MNNINEIKELFRSRWVLVGGEFAEPDTTEDYYNGLLKFLIANQIGSLALGGRLDTDFSKVLGSKLKILIDFEQPITSPKDAIIACSQAEAGIFKVNALIADTGSLAIFSQGQGDRLVSSLPPLSIAIIKDAPIFANLLEFTGQVDKEISFTLITGPSRTADIEKRLVLGVHGPLRVVIWGWNDYLL